MDVHGHAGGDARANALFSALVARYTRHRFIPVAYRFLIANLLIFFALLFFVSKQNQIWIGRAFFVWTSVFNLFVVSVFWAFSLWLGKRQSAIAHVEQETSRAKTANAN